MKRKLNRLKSVRQRYGLKIEQVCRVEIPTYPILP